MSYTQGSVLTAADFNSFAGPTIGVSANSVNSVWSTGSGLYGYGQPAISQVSNGVTVTATQWASLINTLNSVLLHQSGATSGITAVTAGSKINFLSGLQSSTITAYNTNLAAATTGPTVTGTVFSAVWTNSGTSGTISRSFGLSAGFANADAVRYFLNAGGKLKFNVSATQNSSTTGRTNDVINIINGLGGVSAVGAANNGGSTSGTGSVTISQNTGVGFYNSSNGANLAPVTATSTTVNYTTDTATVSLNPVGSIGSNNGIGTNLNLWLNVNSTAGSFDNSLGVLVSYSLDVTYPESTYIANTWGAVVVTQL